MWVFRIPIWLIVSDFINWPCAGLLPLHIIAFVDSSSYPSTCDDVRENKISIQMFFKFITINSCCVLLRTFVWIFSRSRDVENRAKNFCVSWALVEWCWWILPNSSQMSSTLGRQAFLKFLELARVVMMSIVWCGKLKVIKSFESMIYDIFQDFLISADDLSGYIRFSYLKKPHRFAAIVRWSKALFARNWKSINFQPFNMLLILLQNMYENSSVRKIS